MTLLESFARRYAKQVRGHPGTRQIKGAAFDSRKIKPGDLFWALPGLTQDGHQFLQQAKEAGAVAAVVTRFQDVDIVQIRVTDVLETMMLAAQVRRASWQQTCVIAITGSAGKTTCKEMLTQICKKKGSVYATPGNYNNQLGLSYTILNAPQSAQFVVLELGISEIGDMEALAKIARPDVAFVSNIAACHLSGLGSEAKIASEKSKIYQ